MAKYELRMPKMGESIIEATILSWSKSVGDRIEMDETVVEIATDKVDSEVPSPVEGTLLEIMFDVDAVVPVGEVIAIIGTEGEESSDGEKDSTAQVNEKQDESVSEPTPAKATAPKTAPQVATSVDVSTIESSNIPANVEGSFYSPLVRNIAQTEGISLDELQSISGSGARGRVTKSDIMAYLEERKSGGLQKKEIPTQTTTQVSSNTGLTKPVSASNGRHDSSGNVEIVEMDRMRKLIAKHMVESKHTSPHVTSFVEADVTNIVQWRNKVKKKFQEKYGEKITYTPIFIEAVVKAIRELPGINISLDGDKIIYKKDINIGMAAALPNGNLIVPVIQHADQLNLLGLTRAVNDLAGRARNNQLKPDEIQGGTYTVTNVGTFGNVMGTPIINQPQVAILAMGAIRKMPAVVETAQGDMIGIRHKMFLSHSYDHRIVDGFLGGTFVRKVADFLEAFDTEQEI
jgi:2-oxoglutarate dehydrogenase E2 component (dihydrolipoamide succinyltransferase)